MPKGLSLAEVARRRLEGIRGKGPIWERRSAESNDLYIEHFEPFYIAQLEASLESIDAFGYDRLLKYAEAMSRLGPEARKKLIEKIKSKVGAVK